MAELFKQRRLPRRSALIVGVTVLLVAALWGRFVWEEVRAADQRIGVFFGPISEDARGGRVIDSVTDDGPARRAGLRGGDIVLAIDDRPIVDARSYDEAARHYERGAPRRFRVARGDQVLEIEVRPGVEADLTTAYKNALVALFCLIVAIPTYLQRPDDHRARLLAAFLALLACEFVFPVGIDARSGTRIAFSVLYPIVFTGLQMAVELHLVSVLPRPQPWLRKRPWIVPGYYFAGFLLGGVSAVTYLLEDVAGRDLLPWGTAQTGHMLNNFLIPLWSFAVLVILGSTARHAEHRQGRFQAALVFLGVLPWALYAMSGPITAAFNKAPPLWLDPLVSYLVLFFPASIFLAVFKYQLFDLEVVVRRSMVYATLSAALILLFYTALGAGSWLFAQVLRHGDATSGGESDSLWVMSATTLLLGLLFTPLRRATQDFIDRRFFPGRRVMRRRLVELTSELPALGGLGRMGARLVERLCEIFTTTSASLLLTDPQAKVLISLASHHERLGPHPSLLLALDDPGIELLRATDRPMSAVELERVSPTLALALRQERPKLAVPLRLEDRLIGVLLLGRTATGRRLRGEELELLSLLSHHVAIVFENVRLFQSATYESLTGLLRREAVLGVLDKEVDRAVRYGRPLAVALADLDHFKAINDTFGHLEGDRVLRRVAEVLSANLRSSDTLGRYGGEEFLLVFPETPIAAGTRLAEKLRAAIEAIRIESGDGRRMEVRVSIGIAGLPTLRDAGGNLGERLLAAADRELYRAKEAGRNRVEPCAATGA